jgi:hypothetical protein
MKKVKTKSYATWDDVITCSEQEPEGIPNTIFGIDEESMEFRRFCELFKIDIPYTSRAQLLDI